MDCDGFMDMDWLEQHSSDEDSEEELDRVGGAPVKFFTNELSCRGRLHRRLISNPTSRIYSAVFDLVAKVLICALYVIRVLYDDHRMYACDGHRCSPEEADDPNSPVFTSTNINWHVIVWVHRPLALWVFQVILCLLTASKTVLYVSIATKHSVCDQILTTNFLLEMVCSLPLLATVFYPVLLRDLFVPLFLHCWLAKGALRRLMNDLHLTKQKFQTLSVTLNQQICFVTVTIICIIFTTICGIQHIQRSSADKPLNMFEAVYFVIVTFSTVGYGDISPDIWLGQLFMLFMICVAFAFIPKQMEEIGSTWAQKKKTGGDYGKRTAERGQHVVVYASSFTADVVMNFLNEFYEHPKLEEHRVILMSSEELDSNMLFILKDPKWAHRVVYIRGSPLKDIDLKRCRINNAESVFFLRDKKSPDQEKADQHTILRSWAVKDFAPDCRQYVQLFKATNKQHVRFAEHVVCEDEFKFALLANNCLYPGLSTLVTLILYTSRGKEGQLAKDPWQRVYGRHSGNEIYHIQLSKSVFFNRFEGRSFLQASAEVHEKLGVCLVAVLDSTNNELRLKLNPGPDYILKGSDYCFYMSLTKEEYSEVTMLHEEEQATPLSFLDTDSPAFPLLNMTTDEAETAEEVTLPDEPIKMRLGETDDTCSSDRIYRLLGNVKKDSIMAGPLPNSMPVGTKRIICHLHCEPRPVCCVLWGVDCEHCSFKKAADSRWTKQLIILSVKECSPAVYNFIIPLRSSYLALGSLYPVVLLVNDEPDSLFLETIAHFPLVFWMKGSLESLDDLLKAGIHKAIHLVISNIGATHGAGSAEGLEDAETIVMVQKITRLFPSVNIITEMKEDSNMRFMHFQAHDMYTQEISRLEKRLKEKTVSNVSYMFRLPFAAGQVFSSAMLDRLLYQTFVKGYLICFVRLLLGIDAQKRSGHLSCVQVTRAMATEFPTYGELYQWLCGHSGQIPIALYKTERRPGLSLDIQQSLLMGNNNALSIQKGRPSIGSALFQKVEDYGNVAGFINDRLEHLKIATDEAYVARKPPRTLSYVIVNPSPSRKLKNGDMIYVLQPSSMQASPRKQQHQHWTSAAYSSHQQPPPPPLSQVFDPVPSSTHGSEPPTFPKSASQVRWNLNPSGNSFESRSPSENLKAETGEGAELSSPSASPPSSHQPFSVQTGKNAEELSPVQTGKTAEELSPMQTGKNAEELSPMETGKNADELSPEQTGKNAEELSPMQTGKNADELSPMETGKNADELSPEETRKNAEESSPLQNGKNADEPSVQSRQNADAPSSQEPSVNTDEPSVQTRMKEHSPPQTRKDADVPSHKNADEPSPPQTRENANEHSPLQTRENADEPSPPQTRENADEPSPSQTRQNKLSSLQNRKNTDEPSPVQTNTNTDESSSHIRKHTHSSSSSSQDDLGIQDTVLGKDAQEKAGSAPSASPQMPSKAISDEDALLYRQEEEDDTSEHQSMLKKGSSPKSVSWGLLAGEDAATDEVHV